MHVVATAGHVDHGKSTLVRALTGIEPDRFAEERRRGLTIDLGYAWTTLPGGAQLAFVDVPGHQRFIANMLAGVGPAPAVLFVLAADEGWSRQSGEHLAAIEALQLRHGLLAVTRSDLADPAAALADGRARLAASSLGQVEAVAVSGTTGAGLGELRTALGRLVARLPQPDTSAQVRLWLDRSFSIRGSGTVVTGTLSGGRLAVGDALALHRGSGSPLPVTVRGLQSAGQARESVDAVARVAVNLRGVPGDAATRGDVLLTPDAWHLTGTVDARLSTDDRLPSELVLHVGTAAVPVRLRPLGTATAGTTTARLTLATALPLRAGDRAVLRDPGRQAVAAGVLVLDADPPALRRRGAAAARARALAAATGTPDAAAEVGRRGAVPRAYLARLGVDTASLPDVGGWLVDPDRRAGWIAAAGAAVDDWARAHPLDPGVPAAALRHALGLPAAPPVLADLVAAAGLRAADGRVSRPGTASSLGGAEPAARTLEQRLREHPFAAPERDELAALRLGPRELAAAERAGRLYRVSTDIVLLPEAIDEAVRRLAALPQPFTASSARQALGSTRRVVIPLLEHLDELGRTERVDGASRRVR